MQYARAFIGLQVALSLASVSIAGSPTAPMPPASEPLSARERVLYFLNARRAEMLALTAARIVYDYDFSPSLVAEVGSTTNILAGNRYRYWATPIWNNDLDVSWEVVFDGVRHSLFTRRATIPGRSGLLIETHSDVRANPIGIPIAWSLGMDYLSPDGDNCASCRLRVADLGSDSYWNSRVGAMTAAYQPDGTILARFPGTVIDGVTTAFVVVFSVAAEGIDPARIERRALPGDGAVSILALSGWETHQGPGGVVRLPALIEVQARDAASDPWQNVGYMALRTVEMTPLDPAAFQVLPNMLVWSNDLGSFVR